MASTPQARLKRDVLSGSEGRHLPLHILFVHSHAAEVERCLQELNKVHFTVSAEVVVTPEEFSERLGSHAYDLVVAEYPSPDWRETQTLELLHLSKSQIPLIFVCGILQRETVAEFITRGAYDCIKMGRISHLLGLLECCLARNFLLLPAGYALRDEFSGDRTLGDSLPIRASARSSNSRIQVACAANGSAGPRGRPGSSADPHRSPCEAVRSPGLGFQVAHRLQRPCGTCDACVGAACRLAGRGGPTLLPFRFRRA